MKKTREGCVIFGVLGLLGLFVYSSFHYEYIMLLGRKVIRFHLLALTLTEGWGFLLTCLFAGMIVYGIDPMKKSK